MVEPNEEEEEEEKKDDDDDNDSNDDIHCLPNKRQVWMQCSLCKNA
jgi:hypothetical protein